MKNTRKVVVLLLSLMLVLGALFALTACGGETAHEHSWADATCTTPKTCTTCGATAGLALGHVGGTATCEDRAACDRCGELYGSTAAHDWVTVNCLTKKCKVCSKTEGTGLSHSGGAEVCGSYKACEVCGELYGAVVTHHGYTQKIRSDKALAVAASCKGPAIYYLTCTCGAISYDSAYTFEYGVALDHKDDNLDHACDYGCRTEMGDHVDADKNHVCDYGCAVAFGEHKDGDKDHFCDKYGAECGLGGIGEHVDADKDHRCDIGCKVQMGDCEDVVKDHYCDYGCGKYFGIHEDMNHDHACEYGCDVKIGSCVDNNKDHNCDYGCGVKFGGECFDSTTDVDHACDYCGKILSNCVDANTDHKCDICGMNKFGKCEDKDLDHKCDYGCDKEYGICQDANKDHKCDYGCTKTFGGKCADNKKLVDDVFVKGYDHLCDYCGEKISECVDEIYTVPCAACGNEGCTLCRPSGRDHICDVCGGTVGEHADADKDHACDYEGCILGTFFGVHADVEGPDHKCDYGCEERIGGECFDSDDRGHACDYCGTPNISDHVDANKDHVCDECSKTISACEDESGDHLCDVYGEDCKDENGETNFFGKCEDEKKINDQGKVIKGHDHYCDYGCGKYFGEHEDENKDHFCDYGCDVKIGKHADAELDHACDYCGANMGEHVDADKDHACDYGCNVADFGKHEDLNHDHLCDVYGADCANGKFGDCVDVDVKDHFCDYGYGYEDGCKVAFGVCIDTKNDGDHVCDYGCGKVFSVCVDATKPGTEVDPETGAVIPVLGVDHYCDECDEPMGECTDKTGEEEDGDHLCDYGCGAVKNACVNNDADDHNCDICGNRMIDEATGEPVACKDANNDHYCDVCSLKLTKCLDENKDHKCDNGCDLVFGGECADEMALVDEVLVAGKKDHLCDYCSEKISEHDNKDADDHECDICGKTLTECADDYKIVEGELVAGVDHACDVCGKKITKCLDADKNHACDNGCDKVFGGECADVSHVVVVPGKDGAEDEVNVVAGADHLCDYCGEKISEHDNKDADDHECDICGETLTECADDYKIVEGEVVAGVDHACDVCGKIVSKCVDTDKDHYCDNECGKRFGGECEDKTKLVEDEIVAGADHYCDYCEEPLSDCENNDTDDHECDICGKTLTECLDETKIVEGELVAGVDHACDVCGKIVSKCVDTDKDHACDEGCGKVFGGECADEMALIEEVLVAGKKDHLCDYCSEKISEHDNKDADDHECDICGETLTECADNNADHKCDVCDKKLTKCVDVDVKDHICDICEAELSECDDKTKVVDDETVAGKDHLCDYCGEMVDDGCVDVANDGDHKCDICGETMEDAVCADGDTNHLCDECGEKVGVHADVADPVTGLKDHYCDYCEGSMGECSDAANDGDHVCDYGCGKVWNECIDETHIVVTPGAEGEEDVIEFVNGADHKCDECGNVLGEHVNADADDHDCDICKERISECGDANADHLCDVCSLKISKCVDEGKDHYCDICEEPMGDCSDVAGDGDHVCDYGCGKVWNDCVDEMTIVVTPGAEGEEDVIEFVNGADHKCDECDKVLNECVDADTNHLCDICGKVISAHVDAEKDHICDNGCEVAIGEHKDSDADKDHVCDYCSGEIDEEEREQCVDNKKPGLDADGKTIIEVDGKDHKCDICGETMPEDEGCVDAANDGNHECDICGETMEDAVCADDDKNHLCDECGTVVTPHVDAEQDHICDNGCEVAIGEHKDSETDKDHVCDYCGGAIENGEICEDKTHIEYVPVEEGSEELVPVVKNGADHICDVCGAENVGEHKDAADDDDHVCDICGGEIENGEQHVDADKNHVCDVCDGVASKCVNADKAEDHLCDICGGRLDICVDAGKDHYCDVCEEGMGECADAENDGDHVCDYGCGKVWNEHIDETHIVVTPGEDGAEDTEEVVTGKDHYCDECGDPMGDCEDKNLDHACDYGCVTDKFATGENAHADANKDHACDYEGCTLGNFGECVDADKNHVCDYCGENDGKHVDLPVYDEETGEIVELPDHICDAYGADCKLGAVTECVDADKDHVCDICGVNDNAHADIQKPGTVVDAETGEPVDGMVDGTDHLCDKYGADCKLGAVTECVDAEKDEDHDCDICGAEKITAHEDTNDDHLCDNGCGKLVTSHKDEVGNDHVCDICGKFYAECVDALKTVRDPVTGEPVLDNGNLIIEPGKDHWCDICESPMGDCEDADGDGDHLCDYGCGAIKSEHVDETKPGENEGEIVAGKDHYCDECEDGMDDCIDADKDHACDFGCDKKFGEHVDAGKDHACDYEGCTLGTFGKHEDANKDHNCDYCGQADVEKFGEHVDAKKPGKVPGEGDEMVDGMVDGHDHVCDFYGEACKLGKIEECVDEGKDHKCDLCGETMPEDIGCVDLPVYDEETGELVALPDHKCDYCNKVLSECAEGEKIDHNCDYCGKEKISEHVDADKDHLCDNCCAVTDFGAHVDANKDHLCDTYGDECKVGKFGKCEDLDKDHKCDYGCKKAYGVHADAKKPGQVEGEDGEMVDGMVDGRDHLCDVYGEACKLGKIEECEEGKKADHKCDYCGTELSKCKDETKVVDGEPVDGKDHLCDVCNKELSKCEEGAKIDHNCDYCGATGITAHVDANKDHFCDNNCNVAFGVHEDKADINHVCDYYGDKCALGAIGGEHKPGADKHNCDYCGKLANDGCVDAKDPETGFADHYCDICEEAMGDDCGDDKNGDNKCDVCGKDIVPVVPHDHEDGDGDHICDADDCGYRVTPCVDAEKDHICDVCGEQGQLPSHEDLTKDHLCDAYGAECAFGKVSECEDKAPADHFCDICEAPMGECGVDENGDNKCDVCGKTVNTDAHATHFSEDGDHFCDYVGCNEIIHVDLGHDHDCDDPTCGKVLGSKKDADGDGKCDYCGQPKH